MDRLEHLKSMLEEQPNDSFIIFAIAKEYEKSGDLDMAISSFEKLVKLDKSYVGTYYHLAYLYAETDQLDRAIACYNDGIEVAKKLSDFHALSELVNAKKNLEIERL